MKKSEMVAQLVALRRRFQSLGNVSIFSLVEQTGYFELHHEVSESDIRAALISFPKCLQEWLQYSADKRTSTGWYLAENDEECYETGYIAVDQIRMNRCSTRNGIMACACFIKHELESIRVA